MAQKTTFATVLLVLLSMGSMGQQVGPANSVPDIVARFVAVESTAQRAQADYDFEEEIVVQELNRGGGTVGEFRTVVANALNKKNGKRELKNVFGPQSTMKTIGITREDLQDLVEVQPFAITADNVQKYSFELAGEEIVDGIACVLIDARPLKIEKGQRYFQGILWIDKMEPHVVKTLGRSVPDVKKPNDENLFVALQTRRRNIDGYWFPDSMEGRETLPFKTGPVDIRIVVRFAKYHKQ